jgi:hypothetical protein
MVQHTCEVCLRIFKQKGHLESHKNKKTACVRNTALDELIEKKVQEALLKTNVNLVIPVATHMVATTQIQDTGKFRVNTKDQFYTNTEVAKTCIQRITECLPETRSYFWIEPSAGNGSFLHNVPAHIEKIGLDIDPKSDGIISQDYLQWTPTTEKDILVFGNPPFGRQSSLAKSFIAKSCTFAKVIAFILPKSFTKPSMFRTFDSKFHCINTLELASDSFILNGAAYDVPCVFQIWQKMETDRPLDTDIQPHGFQYVKITDSYDIAFRRVGGKAGTCYKRDTASFSVQSHYFIRFDREAVKSVDTLIDQINSHTFPSNTLGPRSLSKCEVNTVINDLIGKTE